MSLLKESPGAAVPAKVEILPDGRRRLTRWRVLNTTEHVVDTLVKDWGTLDAAPTDEAHDTAGFANLRLVDQFQADSGSVQGYGPGKPIWVTVFETLPATGMIQAGRDTKIELEDGRSATERNFLQLSSVSFTPTIAGTFLNDYGYLQREEAVDDGAVRKIKRIYVEAGTLETDDQTLQGGKLLRRTIVSAVTVPSTPSGYTLVGAPVKSPSGLPIYTYTFYKGEGETGRRTSSDNGGKLQRVVITHLTAGSVDAQPTSDPLSGGVAVVTGKDERDGYRVWEVTWGKGVGEISRRISSDSGGKLQRVVITHLTAVTENSQPTSDPLSGGVAVVTNRSDDAAHRVWEVTWVKGEGEVSRRTSNDNGGKLQRVTIAHLTGLGTAVQPTSDPLSGGVAVEIDQRDEAGYRIWTVTWAKGLGEVSRATETRYNGRLSRVTLTHLTALETSTQPTSDPFTTGGSRVSESRRDEAGHRVWTVTWAKADSSGLIVDNLATRNNGKLIVYRRTRFGAAPAAPSATISGTVSLLTDDTEQADGFTIYGRTWTEGVGTIATTEEYEEGNLVVTTTERIIAPTGDLPTEPDHLLTRKVSDADGYRVLVDRWISAGADESTYTEATRADGSTEYAVVVFSDVESVPGDPTAGDGYLVAKRHQKRPGGYFTNQATYITLPETLTLKRQMSFSMPGLAAFSGTQLVLDPPVTKLVLANVEISYAEAQLDAAVWTVVRYAGYYEAYTPKATRVPVSRSQGLGGYVGSANVVGSNGDFNGVECSTYAASVVASNPTTRPSGTTVLQVDNDIYLVALDGTVVYRRTYATASV